MLTALHGCGYTIIIEWCLSQISPVNIPLAPQVQLYTTAIDNKAVVKQRTTLCQSLPETMGMK